MEHRSPDGDCRPLDDVRRRVVQPTIESQAGQLGKGNRTNEIAAHLVAGKSLPVEQHDAESQPTQVRRRGRPRRSRPDDDDITVNRWDCPQRHHRSRTQSPADAARGTPPRGSTLS